MGGCCILYCRNSTEKGFMMKSFPTIPEKRELWMKMIARPDWDPGLKSRVCEAHFTCDMWDIESGKRFLRRNAVPTIFPKPPPRVINAEKRIIGRRRNEPRSVLTDHAYVNKPAEIEVRIPDLPKVILQLNAEEAIQLKRVPESKSILQKNVQPKISDKVQIELINEEKLANKLITPFSEDQIKKATDVQENRILELSKEATQFKKIQSKPILPKYFQSNVENGITIDRVQEELKLVNRPIFPPLSVEQMKKLIDTQAKKLLELKKKLKAHTFVERKANRENGLYQAIVQSLFSDDQIRLLLSKQMNQPSTRSRKWSDTTIEKALRFKSVCGNGGYDELLKLGYPFPSLRTLNRGKLKLINSEESAIQTLDDIAKKVSKNVTKKDPKRKVEVLKKVHNGELFIDDKDLKDEKESQAKKLKINISEKNLFFNCIN